MVRNDENLKSAEDFLRETLAKNFGQHLDSDRLREAAKKLCKATIWR